MYSKTRVDKNKMCVCTLYKIWLPINYIYIRENSISFQYLYENIYNNLIKVFLVNEQYFLILYPHPVL